MNSMDTVAGYTVVRRPEWNFDVAARGGFNRHAPNIDGIYYGGADRMPWFDADEAYWEGILPMELRRMRETAKSHDFTGLGLVSSIEQARSLLSFCNRNERHNEIISVFSEVLASLSGALMPAPHRLTWLGWDAVLLGSYSLLEEGVFWHPELFGEYRDVVNRHGLLPSVEEAERYVSRYRALNDEGVLEEPLVEQPYPVDLIRIGRISAD